MKPRRIAIAVGSSLAALCALPAALAQTPEPPPKPSHSKSSTAPAAARPNQPPTAVGFWAQTSDDGRVGGWFYFWVKDGLYRGRIVKMFKNPDDPTVYSNTCDKCAGDQKGAPMLGLTIIKGMKRSGNEYADGSILDPRDGTVYHAQMELSPDGQKLSVRGYLGIPLLGQTQVWTRLPDDTIAQKDLPKESFGPDAAPNSTAE